MNQFHQERALGAGDRSHRLPEGAAAIPGCPCTTCEARRANAIDLQPSEFKEEPS